MISVKKAFYLAFCDWNKGLNNLLKERYDFAFQENRKRKLRLIGKTKKLTNHC